jgi:hypothetical protein
MATSALFILLFFFTESSPRMSVHRLHPGFMLCFVASLTLLVADETEFLGLFLLFRLLRDDGTQKESACYQRNRRY